MDITESKRAEEAVRESEGRLRLAQQVAHIGTFEWNVQTGLSIWTKELEAMHGRQSGEFDFSRPSWEQLVHPDDRAEAVGSVEEAFATGAVTEGEWRILLARRERALDRRQLSGLPG